MYFYILASSSIKVSFAKQILLYRKHDARVMFYAIGKIISSLHVWMINRAEIPCLCNIDTCQLWTKGSWSYVLYKATSFHKESFFGGVLWRSVGCRQ